MTDEEFNSTLDSFAQTIVDTLQGDSVEDYYPTILVIDSDGKIGFEQLLPLFGVAELAEVHQMAVAFGQQLSKAYKDVAAVFVAVQSVDESEPPHIAISGVAGDGRTNAGKILCRRDDQAALETVSVWRGHYGGTPSPEVAHNIAASVLMGFDMPKGDR